MDLSGIRVLDLSRLLPGPYGTQLLGDMGADVIKVEQPGVGDYAREMDAAGGRDGVFGAVNRGKRSVALDLGDAEGREAFFRLVESADVVLEQFRPGVVDDLGVGYGAVRDRNAEIVYCSLSGYGDRGPYRDLAGHDLNYLGVAGFLDLTRPERDAPPVHPGYPVADMAGGLFAAFAIVGALLSRELGNGGGEHLQVAMADVVLSFAQGVAFQAFAGEDPRAGETALTGKYPCYDIYETADGRFLTLAALEPAFFEAFCAEIGRPDLAADHLASDPAVRASVRTEIATAIGERTLDEWEARLGDVDAMLAPVHTLAEALDHPQFAGRGRITEDGPVPRVGFPAETTAGLGGHADGIPERGAHTGSLLREHGYAEATLDRLEAAGVIELAD